MENTKSHMGEKLWDEMLKAIVGTMPEQLFPLFKQVYGKEYPRGTPIQLLSTEYSTFEENTSFPPSSRLMDIALLVDGADYYHIECQMKNDSQMVIRMITYDLHFALQHTTTLDDLTGEIFIQFPRSVVIYPDSNSSLPDTLKCRLLFQDGSEHIYQIPTVKIQSYSLEELQEKHLNLFLPFTLLRLKPRLKSSHPLTVEELTEFIASIIVILKEELAGGYISQLEMEDYLNLINFASERIFFHQPDYHEEVLNMTKSMIVLPSQLRDIIERQQKELEELTEQKNKELAELTEEKNRILEQKDTIIAHLQEQLATAGLN